MLRRCGRARRAKTAALERGDEGGFSGSSARPHRKRGQRVGRPTFAAAGRTLRLQPSSQPRPRSL
eukprot:10105266-Alexandrium_andersonii.AAC.1